MHIEAIIRSITFNERQRPEIFDWSRRGRIASGSGTNPLDVNDLLKQFKQMQKMMKMMTGGGGMKGLGKGKKRMMNNMRQWMEQ
jgi:signal recognition particle subunit SRP54